MPFSNTNTDERTRTVEKGDEQEDKCKKNFRRQRQRRLKNIGNAESGGNKTIERDVFHEESNCIEQEEEIKAETVAEERV